MAKYEDKVLNYLESSSLDDWTYNKAITKMNESFRVSTHVKEKLNYMRR